MHKFSISPRPRFASIYKKTGMGCCWQPDPPAAALPENSHPPIRGKGVAHGVLKRRKSIQSMSWQHHVMMLRICCSSVIDRLSRISSWESLQPATGGRTTLWLLLRRQVAKVEVPQSGFVWSLWGDAEHCQLLQPAAIPKRWPQYLKMGLKTTNIGPWSSPVQGRVGTGMSLQVPRVLVLEAASPDSRQGMSRAGWSFWNHLEIHLSGLLYPLRAKNILVWGSTSSGISNPSSSSLEVRIRSGKTFPGWGCAGGSASLPTLGWSLGWPEVGKFQPSQQQFIILLSFSSHISLLKWSFKSLLLSLSDCSAV